MRVRINIKVIAGVLGILAVETTLLLALWGVDSIHGQAITNWPAFVWFMVLVNCVGALALTCIAVNVEGLDEGK